MARRISQRELRNESGAIMRALDQGEEFVVTRGGVPVGELRPARSRFVDRDVLIEAFRHLPHLEAERFRDDVDEIVDQSIEPRT